MKEVLLETNLPGVPLFARGKVRDIYDLGGELLIVATDRISAYDVVMPNGIPGKGKILNGMSAFWFANTRQRVRNHLITANINRYPEELRQYRNQLDGRSMLVKKANRVNVECVARGYLAGSGWREYQQNQNVCGIPLPAGLKESSALPFPIFTPATKEESGHDRNITIEEMCALIGLGLTSELKRITLLIYNRAKLYADKRGILIADTKLEFGIYQNEIILIDEILSPDSSRFWPKDKYEPGRPQESFDKQFLRDWLDSIGWDRQPPAPELPPEIVEKTAAKYQEAYERLVGTA